MSKLLRPLLMACVAPMVFMAPAHAAEGSGSDLLSADRFQVRVRAVSVRPNVDSTVNIGGNVDDIGDGWSPEIDLTYFPMQKVGLELIAATTHHSVQYNVNTHLGNTWLLPPTLTVQYHPLRGSSNFSPYVGAGLNYSIFYNEKSGSAFNNLNVEGGVGYALQAGADYWVNDHWGFNIDVKRLWLNVDANVNLGSTPVRADIDIDPWVVGAGVSYRF